MKKDVLVLGAVILGVLVGWKIGRSAESPPEPVQPAHPQVVTIRIVTDAESRCDKAYDPPIVTVKSGTTVEWINQDYETHTLVSSGGGDPCNPKELSPEMRVIDVGQLPPRKTYRKTFTNPGEYLYMCHLPFHHMSGEIIVVP
ncbi:MAG TPA: plastocyanin/azurin family copper-binding protein [Nitrospiria bacterium]|nr:plastocyanin/azurin family copper-binding protein [Nitrospiria bacterium]